jgi:FkbM family methyltransferase
MIDIESYKKIGNLPEHIKWEWSETIVKIFFNVFSKNIPYGDAIDLGANYGIHSWNLGNIVKKTGNTLIAVEPDPRCYEFLDIVLNKGDFKSVLIKNPISYTGNVSRFRLNPQVQLSKLIDDEVEDDGNDIKVQTLSLDTIAAPYIPKYIKIDIEGQDINAVKGGQTTIKTHRPIISTEWSTLYSTEDQIWYYNFFKNLNYKMIDFLGNEYDGEHWLYQWQPYWNRFLVPAEHCRLFEFKKQLDYMFQHHGMENILK